MQAPNAAATRSVGEKVEPSPMLSLGADVEIVAPEGMCCSEVFLLPA